MKKATEIFGSGYSCSQAVLGRFAEENGLDYDTALKIASGFGAGMARNEEVCGAVTGGIMALGLRYGRTSDTDSTATYDTYGKVNELMERFARENGSCICRKLLGGVDLKTDEGQSQYAQRGLIKVCERCVESAERIVESLM